MGNRHDHLVEEQQVEGLTVKVYVDDDPQNPRTDSDCHNGIMVCWHRGYHLGDEGEAWGKNRRWDDPQEFQRWVDSFDPGSEDDYYLDPDQDDKPRNMLPLGLYDHSGITMYVGGRHAFDGEGWDSGQVGWIYTTNRKLREGGHDPATVTDEEVEVWLRGEVKEYDNYLTGNVYGYVVSDSTDDDINSCWGFSGDPGYCLEEGVAAAKAELAYREAKRQEVRDQHDNA